MFSGLISNTLRGCMQTDTKDRGPCHNTRPPKDSELALYRRPLAAYAAYIPFSTVCLAVDKKHSAWGVRPNLGSISS